MVVIAFLVPLGYLVMRIAEDREVNAATAQARAIGPLIVGENLAALRAAGTSSRREGRRPVAIVRPDGVAIGAAIERDPDALRLAQRGQSFVRSVDDGVDVYQPVVGANGATVVVIVHSAQSRLRHGVTGAWFVLGGLGVILTAGALLFADRVARAATRPLADVASAARRLAEGEKSPRAPSAGPPEVRSVAHALNLLADRVESLRAAERESLADLSHGLRTPITALRLDAELLAPGDERDRLLGDVQRLESAVSGLITTARGGGAHAPGSGPADLAGVARRRLEFWSVAAAEQQREFSAAVPADAVWVACSSHALETAIDALVSNVLRHTPRGTAIHATVTCDWSRAALTIDDAGPGFSSDAVLQRGVHGADTPGTGLGLDIARRTAVSAGGGLSLGTAPAGGARVVMRLPVVKPPDPDLGIT